MTEEQTDLLCDIAALNEVLLSKINDLENTGYVMRQLFKNNTKMYKATLEHFISQLFRTMYSEKMKDYAIEAEKELMLKAKMLEMLIKEFQEGRVTVKIDNE